MPRVTAYLQQRILPEHRTAIVALAERNASTQTEAVRLALTVGLKALGVWPEPKQPGLERSP
jgi:hypothetical protein